MEFFRFKRDIPFMRHALVFNVISLITFLAAVFFLVHKGLNFGVDFRGGTVIEVQYAHPVDFNRLRGAIDKLGLGEYAAQSFGSADTALIRLPLQFVMIALAYWYTRPVNPRRSRAQPY